MYTKKCIKCTSENVPYIYARHEAVLGKDGKQYPLEYEEFVNYMCEDCKEKWYVDLTEKGGSFPSERLDSNKAGEELNAWKPS